MELWVSIKSIVTCLHMQCMKFSEGIFKVHTNQGTIEFVPHESGIHDLDLNGHEDVAIVLFATIRQNF